MSTCAFPLQPTTSTYRTNALGYGVPSLPPPPTVAAPPILDSGDYARPYAYESSKLANMIAFPTDGLGDEWPVATMRIVRAAGNYAIGTAVSTVTGSATGFLLHVKTMCVTPLRETACDGNVYAMTKPRALLVRGDVVTVVGNAAFMGEDLPAIAHVYVASGVVKVLVGCGKPEKPTCVHEEAEDEPCDTEKLFKCIRYYDIVANPCDGCTAFVVGSRNGRAAVFLINLNTGLVIDTTSLYLETEPTADLEEQCTAVSEAVTVTLVSGTMLLVGVHVSESSSMLWALASDTLQEISLTAGTSYNHRLTQRLRLPMHCLDVTVVRVFSLACGTVYAVAIGNFSTVDNNMPSRGVLVYKFTPDTMPDTMFGVSGIALWFDPRSASTRLNDAALSDDGTLYIVGNAYESEPVAQTTAGYKNLSFPFLNVDVLRSNLTYPSPFLVHVRGDGSVCPLLNGLRGCAAGLFANTLIVQPATATVLGDTCFHVGCPGQPAGVLSVDLLLRPCPRILNAHRVAVPVIDLGCDNAPIVVDKKCAETTLQVAGPVVVGCVCETTLPLPGAIAFDPYTGSFMGFDGYSWKAFTMTAPPAV